MPTVEQLTHISAADGEVTSTVTNSDGETTTDWADGTQRVDFPDGAVMVSFPDLSVLNMYPDGSKALNDVNGVALDPASGQPLGSSTTIDTPPLQGPDYLMHLMSGEERIADLQEAQGLIGTFKDALEGEINPAEWFEQWFEMVLVVVKAVETEERGCYYRGWCYGALYSALDMGSPARPRFQNSLGGPDQDVLDGENWDSGVRAAETRMADGADGIGVRNRILLRVAKSGGSPATTLREMYQAACDQTDDWQLKMAFENGLGWPDPTGA